MATYGSQLAALQALTNSLVYQNTSGAIDGTAHNSNEIGQNTSTYANLVAYDNYTYKRVRNGTSNAANGTALRAAYADALTLTPGGNPLSATNRVAILCPPGVYDLGSTGLDLTSEFIDIFGEGAREDVIISSASNTGTGVGTITGSVDGYRLANLTLQNTAPAFSAFDSTDDSAYAPQGAQASVILQNILFYNPILSGDGAPFMRLGVDYGGTYRDCKGLDDIGNSVLFPGASGNFERCTYDYSGFGVFLAPTGTFTDCSLGGQGFGVTFSGTMSGTYTRCVAGSGSFGFSNATVSATFIDCRCLGSGFGTTGATLSGTWTRCISGNTSFVGSVLSGSFLECSAGTGSFSGTTMSGTFTSCLSGATSFVGATMAGVFDKCTAGNSSFGGTSSILSGTFRMCSAGTLSFGYRGSTLSGSFSHCEAGNGSFGNGVDSTTVVTMSGTFDFCKGGNNSFGNCANMTSTAVFRHCSAGNNSFGSLENGGIDTASKFFYCKAGNSSFSYGSTSAAEFHHCSAGDTSFSCIAAVSTECAGSYYNCVGGDICFGASGGTANGVVIEASGNFYGCVGGTNCFGTTSGSFGGALASGRFIGCTAGQGSFGSNDGGGGVGAVRATASGYFESCQGGQNSFAGHIRAEKTGTFVRCSVMTDGALGVASDAGPLTATARMFDCQWVITTAATTALLISAGSKVYGGRYIPGAGATASITSATGGAITASLANILTNTALDVNITNDISSPNVIVDAQV